MEKKNEHADLRHGLSVPKAAEILGVCEQTIRNLYRQCELEGYTVGRKVLIFADSLVAYQTKHSNRPAVAPEPEPEPSYQPFVPRKRRGVPIYDRHCR